MAHHSRLAAFVIDSRTEPDAATRFWGAALGLHQGPDMSSPSYRDLVVPATSPALLVQQIDHESRVHLDIETDDQEAEVKRLEALGAQRIGWVKNWWVLEAPTGHRFCVVVPQRGPLTDENSNRWP